jgi:hypothetical protein
MADVALAPNTGVVEMAPVVADAGAAPAEEVTVDTGSEDQDTGSEDQGDGANQDADTGDHGEDVDDGKTDVKGDDGSDVDDVKDLSIKNVNEKFKELSKTEFGKANSEFLKNLRHNYNQLYNISQAFPTPEAAQTAKDLLGSLGDNPGDAITSLQAAQNDLEALEAQIDASDPDMVAAMFDNSPEGMAGLAPTYLNELYKRSPDAYERTITPPIYNSWVHKEGPVPVMYNAVNLLKAGKTQEAIAALEAFGTTLQNMENYIKSSVNDPLKGEKDKIASERKELGTQAEANFNASIDAQIFPIRDRIMDKALEPYTRGKNLDEARLKTSRKNILSELQRYADEDKTFMQQYGQVRRTKNLGNIVKYTGGKLEEILPGMVDTVAKMFGLTTSATRSGLRDRQRTVIKGNAKGTSARGSQPEGTKDNPMKFEPDMRNIDTRRTSTIMRIRQKQAWGKDGKFYDWN